MSGGWSSNGTKVVYKNPWIEVHEDQVVRPDGSNGIYGVVKTKGGVGVVTVDQNQEIVLVAQFRYPTRTFSLEIPKGAFDAFAGTETPLAAAQRELREETGIRAKRWQDLATVHTLMGYSDDTVHLFVASDVEIGETSLDDDEDLTDLRLPFDAVLETVRHGVVINGRRFHLTDATSISAIFLAKQHGFLK